ncbi:hypothetical protein ACQPZF_03865 [Actinosynnema sp. CS-041913]|uniref:hypothetical protein n=1 Tax=Actinosynnema sp. CS-041913 TaxID=3239917 RepID=UPI003D8FB042
MSSEPPAGTSPPGVPAVLNSVSGTVFGDVVQARSVNLVASTPVLTRYLHQVRKIAPADLVGRAAELDELAAFCATGTGYRWWRAPAWSGKSALVSWFALNPPPGVRVVSFFVTARLAGQNTRTAFVENVLEQLVALLGQAMPPLLTEATREGHLHGLLEEAAATCAERGEHLVLLVDGLDEDRGVTTSPDAHSIAALLPVPPPGLKVIVTGRPDPPIPDDVPDGHPLRDPAIIRPLAPSPQAQAKRVDMERDLKGLLHGTPTEQDLLGLLTAAGGGLTATDLADLTGESPWSIDDHLKTVTGRSFTRRDSHYRPRAAPDVYLLGHEELHVTAVAMLGPRLSGYRDRLHEWARTYRARDWPADTPEYLLRGYHAMLAATGDVPRMVAHSTDPVRHNRMLDQSGGDLAALEEIATTQRALLADHHPDLVSLARLAIHRDHLMSRNARLPHWLPALWASLGNISRAEALAGSIPRGRTRDHALRSVVAEVVRLGDLDRARAMLRVAEEAVPGLWARKSVVRSWILLGELDHAAVLAESIADRQASGEALRHVVEALAVRRELTAARETASRIADPRQLALAQLSVVRAALTQDDLHPVAAVARRIKDPVAQGWALDSIVAELIRRGHPDRAEKTAGWIVESRRRARSQARVARALGVPSRKGGSLTRAVMNASTTSAHEVSGDVLRWTEHLDRTRAMLWAVDAAVAVGDLEQAETVAALIEDVRHHARALGTLVGAAHAVGDFARITRCLDQAEQSVDFTSDRVRQSQALPWLVRAARAADRPARVERLFAAAEASARSIEDLEDQGEAFGWIVRAAVAVGDRRRAEALARAVVSPERRGEAMLPVLRTAAAAGDLDAAEALAGSLVDQVGQSLAWSAVARAAVARGDRQRAEAAVRRSERLARVDVDALGRDRVLLQLVAALAEAGDLDQARLIVSSISGASHGVAARQLLITELLKDKRLKEAETLLAEAQDTTMAAVHDQPTRDNTLGALVEAAVSIGDLDRAELLAAAIRDVDRRDTALGRVIDKAGENGDSDRLDGIIRREGRAARPDHQALEWTIMWTIRAAHDAGDPDRAEALADCLRHPGRRTRVVSLLLDAALRQQDFDRVIRLALSIPNEIRRELSVAQVARAAASSGQHDVLDALIARYSRTRGQWFGPTPVVDALISVGRIGPAEALARSAGDTASGRRSSALIMAASDVRRAEELGASIIDRDREGKDLGLVIRLLAPAVPSALRLVERSLAVARGLPDAAGRDAALKSTVEGVVALGRLDHAEAIAHSIEDPGTRSAAFAGICRAASLSKDRDRAGALADAISTPDPDTARRLLRHLEPGPARRLLARTLVGDRWHRSIPVVCQEAEDGLAALVAELATIDRARGGRGASG